VKLEFLEGQALEGLQQGRLVGWLNKALSVAEAVRQQASRAEEISAGRGEGHAGSPGHQ